MNHIGIVTTIKEAINTSLICQARMDLDFGTTDDEDINVYLVNLLQKEALRPKRKSLLFDFEVATQVKACDNIKNYFLYRNQAEALFLLVGLYKNYSKFHSEIALIERCLDYYQKAYSYGKKINVPSAILDILDKMASRAPIYLLILDHLRSEYFKFIYSLSNGTLYHLTHEK